MARAVEPLLRAAKQHLSADAGPIVGPMSLMLRERRRSEGRSWFNLGPETTREGVVQRPSSACEGGPPMMPPSRKLMTRGFLSGGGEVNAKELERLRTATGDASDVMICSRSLAVFAEMAFRSMYIKLFSFIGPMFSLPALCLIVADDLLASRTLRAVATASRGGTMLRMMSDSATNASSLGREII